MNRNHALLCPTPEWAEHLRTQVLPRLLDRTQLGGRMLEVGPGPGAATEFMRHHVEHLVAVELDQEAVEELRVRFAGSGVEVVHGDATAIPFPDESFDSAGCFTMLHHVPTAELQNKLLSEVRRVLRPGGVLIASDSLPSNSLHHFHEADVYNPMDPASLFPRLQTLGYECITVSDDPTLTFTAHKQG